VSRLAVGRYVRVVGVDSFPQPGHALYRAEGTVEGHIPDDKGGELVQVLLEKPRTSRGLLTNIPEPWLEARRRR
jgi:hypothetical protein